ncbi:hypothetical protein EIP86_000416 [Pleurotus ostreatoroseus]|nr:hypothetical protein EIP86_000416 [Pleurotus ostreatoroseus]
MSGRRGRGGRGVPPRGLPKSLVGRGRGLSTPAAESNTSTVASHVTTVGVKRSAFGSSGTEVKVFTNHFEVTIPQSIIHHYDVMVPSEQTLPSRLTMQIMHALQTETAPEIFTPRAAYDGRKNLFSIRELPFTEGTHTFEVSLGPPVQGGKPSKAFKVTLKHVAVINPELLSRFLEGKQSHDNAVLTAITALNVVVRMQPSLSYPFNVRSFFTPAETSDLGNGLILWRGYFQSIRPGIEKMLVNIDISTTAMFKPGPVKELAKEFFYRSRRITERDLSALSARDRLQLQRFLYGVRVVTRMPNGQLSKVARVLKRISDKGARNHEFALREGGTMTVMAYFEKTYNRPLEFPDLPCVEVGTGALIPMELCEILPGQMMRKQIPPNKVKDVVRFSTKKPQDRLDSIRSAIGVLAYGESEYVRVSGQNKQSWTGTDFHVQEFGLTVDGQNPLLAPARVLDPPRLAYAGVSDPHRA